MVSEYISWSSNFFKCIFPTSKSNAFFFLVKFALMITERAKDGCEVRYSVLGDYQSLKTDGGFSYSSIQCGFEEILATLFPLLSAYIKFTIFFSYPQETSLRQRINSTWQ